MSTSPTPSPRDPLRERLVLSHFTLARDHPLDDRIEAAGAAGFHGIGLFAGQYRRLRDDGLAATQVTEWLAEAGVALSQVEALSGWGSAEPGEAYASFEATVWEMIDTFDVPYVQAIGPHDGSRAEAGERFGALCDRAAEHGATVGLEFLPFTNIVDAGHALEIVERADRDNGGVCVDIWPHERGANDLELIRRIPRERVAGIQMSDGSRTPALDDYKDDCLRNRVPPGAGEFDVAGFVDALLDLGVDRPWDLEVCNDDAWGRPAGDHVAAAAAGMRDVLERCFDARRDESRSNRD